MSPVCSMVRAAMAGTPFTANVPLCLMRFHSPDEIPHTRMRYALAGHSSAVGSVTMCSVIRFAFALNGAGRG